MKIGIEVQRLFRKQKFGIETSALQLIKRMQKLDDKNQFVIYAKNDEDKSCLQESSNLRVKMLTGKVFFDFEHVFLPLAAKKDQVDILHCTGNTTPLFSPVPIVQTLHDVIFMDPISSKDTLYQQFGNRYRRIMIPMTTRKSHAVITVSNYEKERILQKIKLDEKKIRVIYNGIDEDRFRVLTSQSRLISVKAKYRLPDQFILFLGNTSARKNALRVIEAYCLYAGRTKTPMTMVTPGLNDQFIADHLVKIGQTDKKQYFKTTGYIDDADLSPLYNLSTVFLYPSLSEGFGMPLAEAQACGTPVITSSISCLPEVAGDAALLVDPTNTQAIADAIVKMISDETFRKETIKAGLKNARRFSWTKTAESVLEVYNEVHFVHRRVSAAQGKVAYGFR